MRSLYDFIVKPIGDRYNNEIQEECELFCILVVIQMFNAAVITR